MPRLPLKDFRWLTTLLLLAAVLPLAPGRALGAPHVFMIVPQASGRDWQLAEFSSKSRKNIADLHFQVIYGSDDSTLALLDSATNGYRLRAINRKTSKVIADRILTGDWSVHRMQPVENLAAVQSKNSTVYFHALDAATHSFGFVEANWKTGKVRRFPPNPQPPVGDVVAMLPLPSGFAVSGFNNTISIFDTATQSRVLQLHESGDSLSWQYRRMYFVPGTGLMEYYKTTHRRLTDANLTAEASAPEPIPTAAPDTKVQVRTIRGKTCLIWGEDNSAAALTGKYTGEITELVIFDLQAKAELMRKPLGVKASAKFQPDTTGTRIYFFEAQAGKVSFLDTASQAITPLADLGPSQAARSTIVDAY